MTPTVITKSAVIFLFYLLLAKADTESPSNEQGAYHEESRLHTDLLNGYHAEYRPVKDHKSAVNVKIRFALKYLSFDSLEETITVHSWVAMLWKDEFLKWTPSDYGDINEIQMESHEIWTPRLSLFNADATLYQTDVFYTTCIVSSDGTVTCVPHLAHSGICSTTIRRWPYDMHNCTLYFGSWIHTGEQVNFTFYRSKPVMLDDYQNGPGWKLLDVVHERLPGSFSCCPNNTYPMLKYIFVLRREAAGPAAIVVIPSSVIVMLTITSLLLDIKDYTRVFLACFSLFGHFMFLTEIGYNIPKHSSDTPILLLFVRDSMIITLVAILETLVLMALRQRLGPPPTWIVTINRLVNSGPGKYVVFTEFDPTDMDEKFVADDPVSASGQRSNEVSDWIKFANLLNSLVFIVSILVYIIIISTYIPIDN